MKETIAGIGVFIAARVFCAITGYNFGERVAQADHAQAAMEAARKEQSTRCIDNVVHTKANAGFWLDTGKKCKVLP